MKSLRGRFILSHLLPLLIVIPMFGLVLLYLLETQVRLDTLTNDIASQASMVAQATGSHRGIWSDAAEAENFLQDMSNQVDGQVAIFRPSGDLLVSNNPAAEAVIITESQFVGTDGAQVTYLLNQQQLIVTQPIYDNVNRELLGLVRIDQELGGVSDRFQQLRSLVLWAVGIELLLGVCLGLILALRLEEPLRTITAAVGEIATSERVNPIPEKGPLELRNLAASVNGLVERLHMLEETRKRLLANLVHELGRPLGALHAAAQALRGGADQEPALRQELLEGIELQIDNLQPLLNDLAQLHGQLLGTLELERQLVDLSDWLPPLLAPWQASAQEHGLAWQTEIPADLPELFIDQQRIAQALGNIINNAIKYTPPDGRIEITAGPTAQEMFIRITDNGIGMSAEELARIFEPFYRGSKHKRFPQGLGVGLTIARDIVQAHHGRVEVSSREDEGTTFTLYLPL